MTDPEAAYVAGIVDGEGCIRIFKRPDGRFRPEVRVVNTARVLMDYLVRVVGGKAYNQRGGKAHWKDRWQWAVTGAEALRLIETIRPWLVIKREQADIPLQVSRFRVPVSCKRAWSAAERAEAETAFAAMRVLNRRGKAA